MSAGLLLAWAAVTAVGFASNTDPEPMRAVGVQSVVYLAIAWWLGRLPEIARVLAAAPRGTAIGLLAVLAALVAAQLAGRTVVTFPFARWDMYARRRAADPVWVDLTGVMADGRERRIDLSRELPALGRRMTTGLVTLTDRIRTEQDAAEAGRLQASHDATVRAIAARWSAKYPEAGLRAVRVWRITVSTAPYRGPASVVREPFREVPIP